MGKGRTDVDDEQRTGHQNTSTADENTPSASAIIKEKCYIKLTDIDGQMHISVGAARSTDLRNWITAGFLNSGCQKSYSTLTVTVTVMHLTRYAYQGQQI